MAQARKIASVRAVVTLAHYKLNLNGMLAFWIAYILTRPLGASTGDLLSQTVKDGGLGWGTTNTSLVFLATIVSLVVYLTLTGRDRIVPDEQRGLRRSRASQQFRPDFVGAHIQAGEQHQQMEN